MEIYILIQDRESSTLTLPFTDVEKAIDYAVAECRHYDDTDGVVERRNGEDNVMAAIHSDSCEGSYYVIKETLDKTFQP